MLQKHMVDKYNLYFAYGPSKISPQIHATAINIVIFTVVLLQASFLALSILRKGLNDITIYSLVGFLLTILFFFFHIFFSWCKGFSPIGYQNRRSANSSSENSPNHRATNKRFVPEVLEPSASVDENLEESQETIRSYGTNGTDVNQDSLIGA